MTNNKGLKKELGLFDVFSISTGAMFSSGFFLLPGLASQYTGPSIFLAYLVAGILIMPAMFSIAEISTALPRSGGAYYFLDRSLGPLMGTIGGLGTYFAVVFKTAFAIIGIGTYAVIFWDIPVKLVATSATLLFTVLNLIGAKETSGLQNFFVLFLVVVLSAFIFDGIYSVYIASPESKVVIDTNFKPLFTKGFEGVISTAGFVFVSYLGLTQIATVAEEIKNPERNIPLGMLLSLVVTGFIYVAGVFVMVSIIDPAKLPFDMAPAATAASKLFKWLPGENTGEYLMIGAAMAAFASTGNAGLLASSRFPLAMGRDKLFPKIFSKIGKKGTPTPAIILTSSIIILFILFISEEGIVKLASTFQLVVFMFINFAVIVFRKSNISSYDPGYKSPLYPGMQIAGIIISFILIIYMGWATIIFTAVTIGIAALWYRYYARTKVKREGAIFHWFALLGKYQYEDLESEFMGILKEKGLRRGDPFDETIMKAKVTRLNKTMNYEELTNFVAEGFATEMHTSKEKLVEEFYATSPIEPALIIPSISLLYAKDEMIDHPSLHIVLCDEPGIRKPVHKGGITSEDYIRIFFFLVNPTDQPRQQLRMLSRLIDIIERENFRNDILSFTSDRSIKEYLLHNERYVTVELIPNTDQAELIGKKLMEVKIPSGLLVALIERNGKTITPHGSTVLELNDVLTIIGEPKSINSLINKYLGKQIENS